MPIYLGSECLKIISGNSSGETNVYVLDLSTIEDDIDFSSYKAGDIVLLVQSESE